MNVPGRGVNATAAVRFSLLTGCSQTPAGGTKVQKAPQSFLGTDDRTCVPPRTHSGGNP
jgi:hypothetical protein